jgi:hypothetical protein
MDLTRKNRRTGFLLAAIAIGMFVYSFLVIRHRGSLPEPANLTKAQKILRGL